MLYKHWCNRQDAGVPLYTDTFHGGVAFFKVPSPGFPLQEEVLYLLLLQVIHTAHLKSAGHTVKLTATGLSFVTYYLCYLRLVCELGEAVLVLQVTATDRTSAGDWQVPVQNCLPAGDVVQW